MKKKIFISYAWEENSEKDKKVKMFTQWLAVYLKKWDFEVLLDVYENHPGTKLDSFMLEGVNTSRFVLCICTETYTKKMTKIGTGVNTEFTLLQENADSKFIIPIIEKGKFVNLPSFFRGKFVSELNFSEPYSQDNRNNIFELISTLRDEALSVKGVEPKKRIENYYNNVEKFKLLADTIDLMNFECQPEGIVSFQYLLNEGDFEIGLPPMNFTTHWSTSGVQNIHSYNKVQKTFRIHNFTLFEKVRKTSDIPVDDLFHFKWSTTLEIGDGIVWVNKNNFAAIGKILNIDMNSKDEVKSKVTLQYRILNPINITDDFIQSKNN
ncbi:toll/interleukin-1 receptor domain-containing protein [Enterococcus italicus]|uniref:toll/interleukin-1 receptor domain-containing protein n=1 Tax=Enterococcus italicus TaxID=246144 RepID=UPI0028A7D0FC|nr:toll/interleukin-1 receptor domain-containing protein [Enterococcus italicus]